MIHLMITCTSSEPHTTSLLHREISSFSSYIISSSSMLMSFNLFKFFFFNLSCWSWVSSRMTIYRWLEVKTHIRDNIKAGAMNILLIDKVQIIKGFQIILNILCRKGFHTLYLFYAWRRFIVIISSVEFIWLYIIYLFI